MSSGLFKRIWDALDPTITTEESKRIMQAKCDHLYFPHYEFGSKHPVGQMCSLCGDFNSCEDLGITWPKEKA